MTIIVKDTSSLVVQVSHCQGSRRDRCEELAGGAGSHTMYGGGQGSCGVRERCCESEQKKMRVKKGGAGGNKDLLLASAQECC